jgi:arginine/serine-rich splicing factor 1/9
LEDLFEKYGKINYVDLKNRKGPPFAFIEFDDARDAEDAVDARDGYSFDGYKLRVEFQKGSKNGTDSEKSQLSKGGGGGSRSGPPNRRSEYRCIVTGTFLGYVISVINFCNY